MEKLKRMQIADGVYFNSVYDNRFKTMRITANIILPLTKETASVNALLSQVLTRSCREYPDFTLLSKRLSGLYGASLSGGFRKIGDNQVLTISVSGIDDKYTIDKEQISLELSRLLCNIIFEPNTVKNQFLENELEQERRQVLEMIDAEFNDKRIYSVARIISIMCKDEVFGIKRYGTVEKVNEITVTSLYDAWLNMLRTAVFEIMFVGDSDVDDICRIFEDKFAKVERDPQKVDTQIIRTVQKVTEEIEEIDVAQSKLLLGFRTGIAGADEDVIAAKVMCAVLGGSANSKLFNNVREKLSLCYYCLSRFDTEKGIMMVESGVEAQNVEKAKDAILNEIEQMKNGNISDFEIESTKMIMCNSFFSSCDTVGGIENWYTAQMFDNNKKTAEEMAQAVNSITKEQIVSAANKLVLDTVYVLKSKE